MRLGGYSEIAASDGAAGTAAATVAKSDDDSNRASSDRQAKAGCPSHHSV